MKFYCTLSDKNYMLQGLTMFKSLIDNSTEQFVLYYLCFDKETYNSIIKVNQEYNNIVPILLDDLESEFSELNIAKNNRRYDEYCWMFASWFSNYLINTYDINHIMYVDADVYFMKNPQIVFDEINDKSVGIMMHRHVTEKSTYGKYNVGIIYFKSDENGLKVLDWWKDAVINKKYPELATCGDQKYLDAFIPEFGEDTISIIDNGVGHGAPWNWRLYVYEHYEEDGSIIWGDKRQPLVFAHFSQFKFDLENDTLDFSGGKYPDHTLGFQVFNIPEVRQVYYNYFQDIKKTRSIWL